MNMFEFDRAGEVLQAFGPSSAVDVILIATLLFSVFRLLSGTRAMTQMRGLLTLVLVAIALGQLLDLTVVNYLVERSVTVALIGAVIIFQPEIRRGLDRLGRAPVRGFAARPRYDEVINSVVAATGRMSHDRHGGLIVLERETGLQDVIDTGVPVDARISSELLQGIFFPNSPLHDMAVVLRDDRVVAAGCILPLGDGGGAGEHKLGTRHRAAIGITEQTDALTVVVSEETGFISVALAGRLTHVADERRLRAVLEWLLGPSSGARFAPEPVVPG
jgi:diadenylate cyclase